MARKDEWWNDSDLDENERRLTGQNDTAKSTASTTKSKNARRREREKVAAQKRNSVIQTGTSSASLGEGAEGTEGAAEGQGLSKSAKRRRRQSQIKKSSSLAESEALAESIAQITADGKQIPDAAVVNAQKDATQSNLKLSPRSEAAQAWKPKEKQTSAKAQASQQAAALTEAQQLGGMINLSSIPSHSRTNSEMGDQSVRVSVPFNTPAGVPDTHKEIARALSELVNKQGREAQAAAAAGNPISAMSTPDKSSKDSSDKKKTISNYSSADDKTSSSKKSASTPAGAQAMASTPTTAASSAKGSPPATARLSSSESTGSATIAVKADAGAPAKKAGLFEKLCFCLAGKKQPAN